MNGSNSLEPELWGLPYAPESAEIEAGYPTESYREAMARRAGEAELRKLEQIFSTQGPAAEECKRDILKHLMHFLKPDSLPPFFVLLGLVKGLGLAGAQAEYLKKEFKNFLLELMAEDLAEISIEVFQGLKGKRSSSGSIGFPMASAGGNN